MNTKKYNWIIYFIVATIITTVAVQFYWNYKNYQENKRLVMNEIKTSLDSAVEQYFADLSRESFMTILKDDNISQSKKGNTFQFESNIESLQLKINEKINQTKSKTDHSLHKNYDSTNHNSTIIGQTLLSKNKKIGIHIERNDTSFVKVFHGKKKADSLKLIKGLKTIFIAIQNDTIDYNKINDILSKELLEKGIRLSYEFKSVDNDSIQNVFKNRDLNKTTVIASNHTFSGNKKRLKMKYDNPDTEALKRGATGIMLSLILSLAVISSLFYLLRIINGQKQLAEIKNDLISNITHEFKTPITTISTALEAINSFNAIDDTEKTKKYVTISANQIKKLHIMVEKLLETATLDSEKLLLKKEKVAVVNLLEKLTKKHQLITPHKTIVFSSNVEVLHINIDEFHFENAVSNLIDNAIKYGGNHINVEVKTIQNETFISVIDDGSGIDSNQQEKIFDKFYRIPKGNTHDVKGFGIGLYYSKKIIEKHGGIINLISSEGKTIFKIIVPNEH